MNSAVARIVDGMRQEERKLVKQLEELRSAIGDIVGDGASSTPVSGTEWVKEEIPPHLWLVGNLIAAGTTTMLVADSGLGKTTMLTQLTISLSLGRQFCGMHCHGPTRTLTVAAEGARFAYRSRFIETCKSLGVAASDVNDWYIHPPNISDYQLGSPGLRDMIRSCKPGVVVLDTLGYFHRGDENDATEWKRYVMQPVRKLTEEFGCAFILVHHTGKDMDKGGRGTSAQVADVDHYLMLDRPNGTSDLYRELYVRKNKYGRGGHRIPLRFDLDRAVFSPNLKEEPIARDPLRAAIKKMAPNNA